MSEHKYVVINTRFSSAVATSVALCLCLCITVYLAVSDRTVNTAALIGNAKVIVDAGHGDMDGGAVAADGTKEKDINLKIAEYLNELLTKNGIETVMTRIDDTIDYGNAATVQEKKRYDIQSRMKIINDNPDAVFISIHQNYFSETKYSGAQVFYSKNNENSKLLAQEIQTGIVNMLQPENQRQIKESGSEIYLLNNAKIPAVMVECGFLSNTEEAQQLKDEAYQRQLACEIFNAYMNYYQAQK